MSPKARIAPASLGAILVLGCSYLGTAADFDPREIQESRGWIGVPDAPLVRQQNENDCGAAALMTALLHWGIQSSLEEIMAQCSSGSDRGIKAGVLREFARRKGLKAFLFEGRLDDLELELSRRHLIIVGLVKPFARGALLHYEVVAGVHPFGGIVATLDPARGWRQNSFEGFLSEWDPVGRPTLVLFR